MIIKIGIADVDKEVEMRDINLEYESDINGSFISLKLESKEELDKISYLVIQQDCPEFLIPFKKSVSNG